MAFLSYISNKLYWALTQLSVTKLPCTVFLHLPLYFVLFPLTFLLPFGLFIFGFGFGNRVLLCCLSWLWSFYLCLFSVGNHIVILGWNNGHLECVLLSVTELLFLATGMGHLWLCVHPAYFRPSLLSVFVDTLALMSVGAVAQHWPGSQWGQESSMSDFGIKITNEPFS